MYSAFSSTSNGCDPCSTLEDAFGPSMGSSTANVNQLLQQASQNAVMNQHANNIMPGSAVGQSSVVYVQQQPSVQSVNRPAVPNVATMAVNNTANAKQAMNNMVAKAVNPGTATGTVAAPATAVQQIVMDEGFADMSSVVPYSILFMNMGFVVLAALACNEAFKYYINKAIQSAEGQTHYYLAYAIIALVLVVGAHFYSKRATAI